MNPTELLNEAIKTNAGKSNRSEDLENYQRFFVDPIESQILLENTKQLIFGRRGSGKTLVIGALNENIQDSVTETGVMSLSYTAAQFKASAEYGGLIPTLKEKTHAYFHSFIELLSRDIFDFADEVLKKPTLLDYFKMNGPDMKNKRDKFVNLVLELLDTASYGTENPLPSSLRIFREMENVKESNSENNHKISANARASQDDLNIGIKAYLGADLKDVERSRALKKLVYESNRKFNPKKIKELIVEIVSLLGLKYLIIFIDEWMQLAECQIEFAERLKRSLFGEKQISIKIAADPYQGVFNNSGQGHNFRGLEIGGDIFEAVNLDLPFRDESKGRELFSELLFKRLSYWVPELKNAFGTPPNWNSEYFISHIFTNRHSFDELCTASQGLCRDFHALFQKCAKSISWDLTKSKIDTNRIRQVIFERTEKTYGRVIRSIDSNKLLFSVIRPHIMNIKSRYFLVESQPSKFSPIIKNLVSQRIIHQIPMSQIHHSLRGEFDCFQIEYGIFLDLVKAMEFSTGDNIDDLLDSFNVADITAANKKIYLLNLDDNNLFTSPSKTLLCNDCLKEFPSNAREYEIRKMCPHCLSDQ